MDIFEAIHLPALFKFKKCSTTSFDTHYSFCAAVIILFPLVPPKCLLIALQSMQNLIEGFLIT